MTNSTYSKIELLITDRCLILLVALGYFSHSGTYEERHPPHRRSLKKLPPTFMKEIFLAKLCNSSGNLAQKRKSCMYLCFDSSFRRLLQGCFSHNLCLGNICDRGMLALSRGLGLIGGGESGLLCRLLWHLRLRRGLPRETRILFTRGSLQCRVTNATLAGWVAWTNSFGAHQNRADLK